MRYHTSILAFVKSKSVPFRFGLTRRFDTQVRAPLRPSAGEIGMGQRLRFICKQQHDVARQRLLLE